MSFDKAPQDRANATYRWIFHLINTNPHSKAHKLVGYSKKQDLRENADKQQLLISTLSRLLGPTNRYLIDRAWQMEIFRRRPATIGLIEDKIADLYQEYYVLYEDTQFDLPLIAFLEAYYEAVRTGKLDELPPAAKKNSKQQEAEDFSFLGNAYANRQVLVEHCKGLLHRYSRERVTAYWRAYCKRYYPGWLESHQTDGPPLSNKPDDASSEESSEDERATRESLQKLQEKFKSGRR